MFNQKATLRLALLLTACFLPTLPATAASPDDTELTEPTITKGGRIVSGSKSMWQKSGWGQVVVCLDNDAISTLMDQFQFEGGYVSPVFFLENETKVEGATTTFQAGIRSALDSDERLGEYRMVTTLRDDGLIEVHATTDFVSAAKKEELIVRHATFDFPTYLDLRGVYRQGGEDRPFGEGSSETFDAEALANAELHFFPDSPRRSFRVIPKAIGKLEVNDHRMNFWPTDDGELHFLLDIREPKSLSGDGSNLSPNGIDFVAIDELDLPDYAPSGNLLMNPSFEAGFRYWGMPLYVHHMIPVSHTDLFSIDEQEAHSGNRSLKIKAIQEHIPLNVGTLALPFVVDEPYTVSFYAKSSVEEGTSVKVWGRGLAYQLFDPSVVDVPVDGQWKRYELTFTPTERFGGLYFYAQNKFELDPAASVWIDDVQIERGGMTDFSSPALVAALTSAARGNFLEFGQEPRLALELNGEPGVRGEAQITVEDFLSNVLHEVSMPYELDENGHTQIALDSLSEKVHSRGLRGVWVVEGRFTPEGSEQTFTDHFRFSVMDFLENKHKHKNLFNVMWVYALQMGGPEIERFLERERAIGFGSYSYGFIHFAMDSNLDRDRERAELAAAYGFEPMGRGVVGIHHGGNGVISEGGDENKMDDIRDRLNPSEEELAEFEAIVELKARNRPWNNIWWFTGESNPAMMPLAADRDSFAKWLLATNRGIKRGNPDAKVLITGGPWNIDPQHGIKWVEEYIQDTHRIDPSVQFDGAAGHHYRNFPENPDLDSDIAAFIDMLDRNGHSDWPLYINEGGNYQPFNIPQEGISPYIQHSANAWYIGPLSYDVGQGERIAAALTARTWLIGLKYADRLACMHDFNSPSRYVDLDFTPRPYEKVPNTLGKLLGNSTFRRDIRFAPFVRCYVFEDDPTGDAIAALWGFDEGVDRWKKEPPVYQFDFSGVEVTAIDLMENPVELQRTADGKTLIPASPFPVFLRVEPGQFEALGAALEKGTPAAGGGSMLQVVVAPDAKGGATLSARNDIDRASKLEGQMTINQQSHGLSLQVAPRDEELVSYPLEQPARSGAVEPFEWSLQVDGRPAGQGSGQYLLFSGDARTTGSIDWDTLTANPVGNMGTLKAAIRGERLHLYLESSTESAEEDPKSLFEGLGLYFDPFFKPADLGGEKTVKSDLAVYELVKTDSRQLGAMCRYIQGTQAGSGTEYLVVDRVHPDIEVMDRTREGRAAIEIIVPQAVLTPLKFETGTPFGFNLSWGPSASQTASIAPLQGFRSVTQPGDITLVMGIVGQ